MQEPENKPIMRSRSKMALILGILVLTAAIGVLAYLSQPKAETAVQAPNRDLPRRDKHSIGVYSRNESGNSADVPGKESSEKPEQAPVETSAAPVTVFHGETTNDTTDDSAKSSASEANTKQPSKAPPEKKVAKTKPAQSHHKMRRKNEEPFFELPANSGRHLPDNFDRVAK